MAFRASVPYWHFVAGLSGIGLLPNTRPQYPNELSVGIASFHD